MEIQEYLETIVDPTINDLESNPTSVRYAFLACVVAFHSIDYLTHPESFTEPPFPVPERVSRFCSS